MTSNVCEVVPLPLSEAEPPEGVNGWELRPANGSCRSRHPLGYVTPGLPVLQPRAMRLDPNLQLCV